MSKSLVIFLLLALSITTYGRAQDIPPACEQYFQALETCTRNSIEVFEKTDIESVKKLKASQQEMLKIKEMIREGMTQGHADKITTMCMSYPFVSSMMKALTAQTSALAMLGGMNKQCLRQYQNLQLPPGY